MEFRILGPLEVLDNGTPVELGAPKQRAVLAVLLLHPNTVVSTDRLIESVWGEDAPRTAEHSIQIYVSELRKAFDPDGEILVTQRPGYELRIDTESIDARRLESLVKDAEAAKDRGDRPVAAALAAEAIGVWSDEPFVDFAYEEFAQREITRLEELRHRAVAILCESHVHDGNPLEAVPMLRDDVAKDPLREGSRRLLMLALFVGGRQADALREFRDYRDTLADETGLEPSPELLRLEEQILLRDPSLAPAVEEVELPVPAERNPYKGLLAFDEADAGDFFGRDELIERLLATAGSPLTTVVGPSGSGKSSVVRAGLVPALLGGAAGDSGDWSVVTLTPGRFPFAEFDAAMARLSGYGIGASDPGNDASLSRAVLRSLPSESSVMLLVIDQFEELFTLTDETTRRAFLRNLVTAVEDPRKRIRVLLTVRADFYDRPLLYPEFATSFTEHVVNVVPLTPAGIEAAAVGPAQRVGVEFAPDLLAQLVSDMANQPGALPLFQYTLTELFDERDNSLMSLESYESIGGLGGALSKRADAVFETLDPDEKETARDVFLRLVKPTEDRYTRRPVPVLELESVGEATAVSAVLTRFGDERLLTFDRDSRTGAATVEVSHEALLVGWQRLEDWLEEARSDLQQMDGLKTAAGEWESAERDPGYLLTGARLTDYEAWNEVAVVTVPPIAASYLTESVEARTEAEKVEAERAEREAKATRRARIRLWGMLAAVVALVAVVTFVILTAMANRPKAVTFVYDGPDGGGWNDQTVAMIEEASADSGVEVGYRTTLVEGLVPTVSELAESGVELVLNGFGSAYAHVWNDIVPVYRETLFYLPDMTVPRPILEWTAGENPNVSFPWFASHEGAFLAGVIAARTTETNHVGLIGAVDIAVMWQFQIGFEEGVRYVAEAEGRVIEVSIDYLAHPDAPDPESYFSNWTLAYESADRMYRAGADVIFGVAGRSGEGVVDAAIKVTEETGVQRWYIGVDVDEYAIAAADDDSVDRLPHILTSIVKRLDLPVRDAIENYASGVFEAGVVVYGLEREAIDYVQTGGHIAHLVPELEDVKALIIDKTIVVPDMHPDKDYSGFGL